MRIATQLLAAVVLADVRRFLIVSSPKDKRIMYRELPDGHFAPLIDTLETPEGMAVNGTTLYVADPGQAMVLAYDLIVHTHNGLDHLIAMRERKAITKVDAHWVTFGEKMMVSDRGGSKIDYIVNPGTGDAATSMVFQGGDTGTTPSVSSPGGIASAPGSGTVYWVNTASGSSKGSLVVGDLTDGKSEVLATTGDISHGICLTENNIFYTADTEKLYGVKRSGGNPVEVSKTQLTKPRGIAYDGDGTVYVADKLQGKIYSFPANMDNLMETDLTDEGDVDDAYGVAVFIYDPNYEKQPTLVERGLAEFQSFLFRS
jgi:sugar lactone lactonase YvrE